MKIRIYFFSGTGNTEIVARLFQKEFKNKGLNTSIIAIEDILNKKNPLKIHDHDIVGFGYPIHAFNAPRIFFEFIDALPKVNGKKAFTFKTSGDPMCNGGATAMVRKRLKNKGFRVFHEDLIVMPTNVLMKYDDELMKQLYNAAIRKVKRICDEILREKVKLQKNSIILKTITYLFSKMETMGASYLGKFFSILDSCNLCEKCVRNCPTQNIYREEDDIKFKNKCTFCLRCIYTCPKNSITLLYFNFFLIKGGYNINKAINNPNLKGNYITRKTKGYFKHFYPYLISN